MSMSYLCTGIIEYITCWKPHPWFRIDDVNLIISLLLQRKIGLHYGLYVYNRATVLGFLIKWDFVSHFYDYTAVLSFCYMLWLWYNARQVWKRVLKSWRVAGLVCRIFMPPPTLSGGGMLFSGLPSVRCPAVR